MNITVIGAGAWGTALAISLAASHRVTLWARNAAQIEAMRATRRNQRYLPDIPLPDNLELSADFSAALGAVELAIIAVPAAALRATLQQFALPTPPPRRPSSPPAPPPAAGRAGGGLVSPRGGAGRWWGACPPPTPRCEDAPQ